MSSKQFDYFKTICTPAAMSSILLEASNTMSTLAGAFGGTKVQDIFKTKMISELRSKAIEYQAACHFSNVVGGSVETPRSDNDPDLTFPNGYPLEIKVTAGESFLGGAYSKRPSPTLLIAGDESGFFVVLADLKKEDWAPGGESFYGTSLNKPTMVRLLETGRAKIILGNMLVIDKKKNGEPRKKIQIKMEKHLPKDSKCNKPTPKKYELREVTREQATELVQANHYSPVMPKLTKVWLGVFKQEEFVGVVTLGWGTRPLHTIQKIVSKDLTSQDYYEIGKMCLLDSEPRNSETQMLSQLVRWIKENKPHVKYLYTLADGIMGKCGYVYQAANFYYGGEYWTDSYMSNKGEKVHPRTTAELCKENWRWHYTEGSPGFSQEFKDNHDQKVIAALANNSKAPKKQVFWLTPEFLNHKGMKKIKGKMFRYIFPLDKRSKKLLKHSEEIDWKIGSGIYPKEGSLKWRQMVARKKYEDLEGIPKWDLSVVEYNKKNVNAHKKKLR